MFQRLRWVLVVAVVVCIGILGIALAGTGVLNRAVAVGQSSPTTSSSNGVGTSLDGTPAPNFALTDQFGRAHRLSDFQGKIVVLAFIDSRCTDTCPLTAQILTQTVQQLGSKAKKVQLVAVNANPIATSVADVREWSDKHDMTNHWLFLTGGTKQLQAIWRGYDVTSEVEPNGDVSHTPATYIVDREGKERWLFLTDSQKPQMPAEIAALRARLQAMVGG